MFDYDTDLTINSIMVGKETTRWNEKWLNEKNEKMLKNESTSFRISDNIIFDDSDDSTQMMYILFGESHNIYTQMYADLMHGNVCECCGDDITIFNSTGFSICKKCDGN